MGLAAEVLSATLPLFERDWRTVQSRDNHSSPYIKWRQSVLQRDGYKCTNCGTKGDDAEGKNLHVAHHKGHEYGGIKDDERTKQLAHKTSHGVTLCRKCHGEHDYGKGSTYG